MMPLYSSRIVVLLLFASAARAGDEEILIAPPAECSRYGGDVTWPLQGEVKLGDALTKLAELTCERFFIPKSLFAAKVTIDVGSDTMTSTELHSRVEGALRSKGIVLEYAAASRVRRSTAPLSPYSRPQQVSADKLDKAIHCVAEKCTLTREILDAMLGDINGLAASVRMVPSFKDGKAVGFKLFSIRPSSYLSRLGFQNGDTILSLDGIDLSGPDKALEAYTQIRNKKQMKVDIERRGQKLTMEYVVK